MTITAKFPSKCAQCHTSILKGEQIEWSRFAGARHLNCAPTFTPATSEPQDDRAARRARGDCPTCGGSMPRHYARQGFQCDRCSDAEEGIGFGS